jgi:hypothetical protein
LFSPARFFLETSEHAASVHSLDFPANRRGFRERRMLWIMDYGLWIMDYGNAIAVSAIIANIMIAVISWLIAHRKKR